MANELLTFTHTAQEIEQIVVALAERPFKEVFQLISKIQMQHVQQLKNTKAADSYSAQKCSLDAQINSQTHLAANTP